MRSSSDEKSAFRVGVSGMVAGSMEILVTYPLEFAKTAAQLDGSWAQTHTNFKSAGSLSYLRETVKNQGFLGIYRGATPWFVFAGPRSALRFATFEETKKYIRSDFLCGLFAGSVEALVLVTPNQAIQIKLVHDANSGKPRFANEPFLQSLLSIYKIFGFTKGFYCGALPAVLKGATTNGIRFYGYHFLTQYFETNSALSSMLIGGLAGAASAVITQPIDTVKANMMGVDSARYKSSLACTLEILRSDGLFALWRGTTPRTARVFLEVGLQFTLFEQIFRIVDDLFDKKKGATTKH